MEAVRRVVGLEACVVDLHVEITLLVLVVDLVEAPVEVSLQEVPFQA